MTRRRHASDHEARCRTVLIAALLGLPLVVHDAYFLHVLILIGINVMVAVSMWLLGITGLISFGQAGFMFIGAMTTALLTKDLHWPFWIALPFSAAIPALIAAPVGRLSLRVRGVYFFLVTLAFGQVGAPETCRVWTEKSRPTSARVKSPDAWKS